jgi:hypothetical protein
VQEIALVGDFGSSSIFLPTSLHITLKNSAWCEEKITLIGAAHRRIFPRGRPAEQLARSQATEIALLSSSDEIGSSM